jgi:crotonobetainyl-CoA:carnitine CoA-transferase CaiB-like acyl-CoA transferase
MAAFEGVRVLDFSGHFAAAMAAMHLGDLGAEVIKVDPTLEERGRDEPGYLAWNRNKLRVKLDLLVPDDLAEAKRLIADADVAIFDAPPGELERLGLDGPTLTGRHGSLVHAWAPPYGERGRFCSLPPSHHLLAAVTGIARAQASYAGVPVHLISPQAFYGQANCLAIAIGAALYERVRSGRGQAVVVTGLHGAAQVMPTTVFEGGRAGVFPAPVGGAPNYRLYQCADGKWMFLGALFEPVYLRALDVTGVLVDLLGDPQIGGDLGAALVAPGVLVTMAKLEAAFRARTREDWLATLQAADIPCGPVRTREEWFSGETVDANGMRVELEHPALGTVAMPGPSVQMSGTPPRAPRLPAVLANGPVEPRNAPPVAEAVVGSAAVDAEAGGPLAGVRVLDLGVVIAGAFAGTLLTFLGADVVKIETPGGDAFRSYSTAFSAYNRGKRSLVLDLKDPDAKQVFFELVSQADVVLDNFRLGVRERLGISYEILREVNPHIISLSISGYGTKGPQAPLPGFDPLLQAQSGLMQAQGGYGSEPVFHHVAVNDVGSAAMSAFAIVAALFARSSTGEGQSIHTSLANQSVLLQIGALTTYPGAPAPPMGARDCTGERALERYYECADGWIGIACTTASSCAALVDVLGLDPVDVHAALTEGPDGAFAARIAEAVRPLPVERVLTRLGDAGAPATPVPTLEETFADPFLHENGYYESYVDPSFGPASGNAGFARFTRTGTAFRRPAPMLGEHSVEVLHDFGIPQARIDALLASGGTAQPSRP